MVFPDILSFVKNEGCKKATEKKKKKKKSRLTANKSDTGSPVKLEGHFVRFIVFEVPFASAITRFIDPPLPGDILVGETCLAPILRSLQVTEKGL